MPKLTVAPRIRSFICLNAHPVGCAANVEREIAVATQGAPGSGLKHVLVIGASTGYGLSSLVTGVFGYGARGTAICLERAAHGERTASAGYYNLAAAQRLARARGKQIVVINGDAFSEAVKQETLARVAASGVKLDCVVYSLAAPKRTDEKAGVTYNSALKPIGAPFSSQSINLGNDQIQQVDIPPATEAEIEATRKVMGGEDFAAWVHALLDADLLAKGCRVVAYSYIGPELTTPIYRSGTIGKAKEDLEAQTADGVGGAARARRRRRMGQRQQGAGHAGVRGDPGGAAVHQRALQGDEGGGHARGDGGADRAPVSRPPRPRTHAGDRRRGPHPHRRSGDGSGGAGARQRDVEDGDQRDPDVGHRLRRLQARLSRVVRLRGSGRQLRRACRNRRPDCGVESVGNEMRRSSPASGRGSLSRTSIVP